MLVGEIHVAMTGLLRSRKTGLIFLAIASTLFSFSTPVQSSADRLGAISLALQDKDFDKALDLLRPALRASPGDPRLLAMQGAAYSGKGNKREALASFRQALKASPDDLRALEGAVQIEFDDGNPGAIPLLQHILRLRPDDATSHGMLAVLEYQQGNFSNAAAHFEKAGRLFDSQPSALHAYAVCLVRLKRFDQAAKVFERTVALNADDPREREVFAAVQLMAHQPADALATLSPLLQSEHPYIAALELASTAYEETKDTERAVNSLRQAILLEPRNVDLYLDFAFHISYPHGAFQVGIDVLNDGLALQPEAAPLYFARGVLLVQLAQYDQAEADFARSYELNPHQSLTAAAQGLAAAQQNDFGRALAKVRASLAQRPNDPVMLYLQADILAAKGVDPGTQEFRLAVSSARRAVALRPALGVARGVLAKLYLEDGRYPEAIEQCRKALVTEPSDQTVVYHLIQALRKMGKKDEIPELLKRLALLREEASNKEKELYRYKLVDGGK